MKLTAFRLQNYKKVRDTGWVECQELTALVGKNESGKTAVLRGLSKLKPTDGAKYDPLREFPHGRFTDEFKHQDWPAASAKYALSPSDKAQVVQRCSLLGQVESVIVTRHYSDKLTMEFQPLPNAQHLALNEWQCYLDSTLKSVQEVVAPDGKGDAWNPHKNTLQSNLQNRIAQAKSASNAPDLSQIDGLRNEFGSCMNEQWSKDLLMPMVKDLDKFIARLKAIRTLPEAEKWIADQMPFFLYFGNFEVLKSAIYLPEFVGRVNSQNKDPKTRVQNALFKHVGVEVGELAGLGHHQRNQGGENDTVRRQLDELSIKTDSASQAMTKKFADWWLQRHHRFAYRFQGDYFRIWVSDDLDPAEVEFEERSLGMQYFFSFYLLFLVEAKDQHRNCILLLDEPGLHLHGTAQQKLLEFFRKLADPTQPESNQLIYSTHSPFLIDGARLDQARAIYETPTGTQISTEVWPKDRDSLFPLQAALGYSVCQSLFLSNKQVLVEGPTDYIFLHALNEALQTQGQGGLSEEIVMLPVGGAKNMAPLASLLVGHDIQIVLLLDSDKAAQTAIQKVRSIMAELGDMCLQAKQFSQDPAAEELEDLIPESYYLDAVSRAYPNIPLEFTTADSSIPGVVDRVNAVFARSGQLKLDKRRPALVMAQDIREGRASVPLELIELGKKIFAAITAAFANGKERA